MASSRRCGNAYTEPSNRPAARTTPLCEGRSPEPRRIPSECAVSLFQGEALRNVNRWSPSQIKVGETTLRSGSGARSANRTRLVARGLAQRGRAAHTASDSRFARRNRTGPKGRLTDRDLWRAPPGHIFQGFALKKCTAHSEGMRRGSAPERASREPSSADSTGTRPRWGNGVVAPTGTRTRTTRTHRLARALRVGQRHASSSWWGHAVAHACADLGRRDNAVAPTWASAR